MTKVARFGDVTVRYTPTIEDTAVTYERHGIIERRATIASSAAGYRLVDEGGAALVEAEYTVDATVTVLDRDCQVVQRSSDQLRSIVQGHGAILDESEAPQVGCRYVNLVRHLRTGRLGRQESTGLEKSCCTASRLGYTRRGIEFYRVVAFTIINMEDI